MADILSQEELDALLGQMQGGGDDDEPEAADASEPDELEVSEPEPAAASVHDGHQIPAELPPAERRPEAPVAEGFDDDAPANLRNIGLILSIPIEMQVELGRTSMTIHELMQMGQGSVIELNRLASDLIDLAINNHVVAQGEAVVVNENFGFRVVEVDSVRDRISKL
jgi:flagellar motor switch protein FliN